MGTRLLVLRHKPRLSNRCRLFFAGHLQCQRQREQKVLSSLCWTLGPGWGESLGHCGPFAHPEPCFAKPKAGIKWQTQLHSQSCLNPAILKADDASGLQEEIPCSEASFPCRCWGEGWGISILKFQEFQEPFHGSVCSSVKTDFGDFIWWLFPAQLRFLLCRFRYGKFWLSSKVSFLFLSFLKFFPLHLLGVLCLWYVR